MKVIRRIDHILGGHVSLQEVGWSALVGYSKESKETMDKNEWENYRDLENVKDKSSLFSWLKLLATKERRKFYIFDEIYEIVKDKYKSVLELGSGQCHIGVLLEASGIKTRLSELSENLLIENIEGIGSHIEHIDFLRISDDELRGVDCIVAVQLDYIFDKEDITRFLRKCKTAKVDVVFVTTQVIGPFQYLKYKLAKSSRSNDMGVRKHGYVRTLGMYRKISKDLEVDILISRIKDNSSKELDSYYFIRFMN